MFDVDPYAERYAGFEVGQQSRHQNPAGDRSRSPADGRRSALAGFDRRWKHRIAEPLPEIFARQAGGADKAGESARANEMGSAAGQGSLVDGGLRSGGGRAGLD